MKKALVVLAAIALVVALILWVASWFRAPDAVRTSGAKTWPDGMGTLESVAERYPPQQDNAAAVKLATLGNALPKNEAVDEYVWREMARAEMTIGEPPTIPNVDAIRELLLREPVVFKRHFEIGSQAASEARVMQLNVARALVANALVKARANDPAAWEDLRAVWNLARALDGHPQMMANTAALAMARMVNAVAWKMPLPVPAWFGELQQHDYLRPLVEAFQFQARAYYKDGLSIFPTKMFAASVEHDRLIAEQLLKTTQCDVNMPMNKLGVDLRSVWRRAFRYRAEREATANALRIRNGQPIEPKSACSDGTWSLDGTALRFSRELPTEQRDVAIPLLLQVNAAKP